jgi:hypothetical protein
VDLPTTPTNVYAVQTIPTTLSLPATAWADTFTGTVRTGYFHAGSTYLDNGVTKNYGLPDPGNRWCQDIPADSVALPDHSISDLQTAIGDLDQRLDALRHDAARSQRATGLQCLSRAATSPTI